MKLKLIKCIPLAFLLTFVGVASAEDTGMTNSEFLHQPEAQELEVIPGVKLNVTAFSLRNTDTKVTGVGSPLTVDLDYGFSSMFSAGLVLGYGSTAYVRTCTFPKTCNDTTSKGLLDPKLNFKLRFPVGPGTLRVGADVGVAVEHSKIKSSGDSNQASGGTTVTPFVAYELPLSVGLLGLAMQYDVYKSDQKTDDDSFAPGTTYSVTGGQSFGTSAYYEANFRKLTFGGALNYANAGISKASVNGKNLDVDSVINAFGVSFYLPVHFTPTIALLPIASYSVLNYSSMSSVSSAGVFNVGVAGRFSF